MPWVRAGCEHATTAIEIGPDDADAFEISTTSDMQH